MRLAYRIGLSAVILASAIGSQTASAQYYGGYDRPPPPRYQEDDGYDRPPPRRRAVGLNCDAVQSGISGLQPFSCPLPGPRPLGARCFCDMPIASFSAPQTAVGRVVP
ncbi:hypothetical protein ASG40_06705 [Methylobacterium sp. Leaf399]|uniref:hypothetical protein n=1 Tax=unclassified Methylobacterium TaxID=2615210 RepID=UPI0006FAEAEA|nr:MULTISPECIES: hypothetical protein [unclassified Methylobacterium]KQP52537.1 hypothetical protein ASF39_06325 [Methylobacterium sp. Leaf108]KQT11715.1 hypothetical protein ASG40_06705 [Methylobacterium sp. Leaf399]KQT84248.1 hypothetical protein ASG59_02300 [Methylobacterium sp. Leaf466]